jgi:hypothetical protein
MGQNNAFSFKARKNPKINCFQKGNEKKGTRHAVHCSKKRRRGKSNIPRPSSATALVKKKEQQNLLLV